MNKWIEFFLIVKFVSFYLVIKKILMELGLDLYFFNILILIVIEEG